MKKVAGIILGMFFMVGFATAQHGEKVMTNEPVNQKVRAENYVIALMKDISDISDSTHKHHHEGHKSNFKIIHINFDVIAREGVEQETGFKTVMIRLIDPHGTDIYDPVAGGGFFMMGGQKETPYTFKQSFSFDGKSQHIEFLYKHPKKYNKGLHLIEVFMDGSKIGEDHFIIK